jgi:hypothetical protein
MTGGQQFALIGIAVCVILLGWLGWLWSKERRK